MGRYIKNYELATNSYAVKVPYGDALNAPDNPVSGQIRFNVSNNCLEYYANDKWNRVAAKGAVEIVKDEFFANGSETRFGPMAKSYLPNREADVLVFIGNIFQNPGVAYTIDNDFIEFTSVPNFGQFIVVLHNLNSTETV